MRKKSMKVYLIYLKSLSFEKIWRRFASSHLFIFKNKKKKKKKKKKKNAGIFQNKKESFGFVIFYNNMKILDYFRRWCKKCNLVIRIAFSSMYN